jgi:hypothetical protein
VSYSLADVLLISSDYNRQQREGMSMDFKREKSSVWAVDKFGFFG